MIVMPGDTPDTDKLIWEFGIEFAWVSTWQALSVKFTSDADKEAVSRNLTNFSFTELPSFLWINNVCCFLKYEVITKSRLELLDLFELPPGEDRLPRKPI